MKIAYVQEAFAGSKNAAVKQTTQAIKEVARKGAQMAILQELHQTNYFCISKNESIFYLATSFDSDVEYWSKVAKTNGIVLVTSLFEKRAAGIYHNTAVVFDRDGSIAGKYRKMHIPSLPQFYENFYFTPSDDGFKPIKTSLGTLGVLICWDQWFPEAARLMALGGADVLIYVNAMGTFDEDEQEKTKQLKSWIDIGRSHAIANAIPVISVNRTGREGGKNGARGLNFWGNSFVCNSSGEILHSSPEKEDEIFMIDMDLTPNAEIRNAWPFIKDRRIDSYGDLLKRYLI